MNERPSRRLALRALAALPFGALAVAATISPAQAKGSKKQFKYQDKPGPKGQKCAGCRFFQKPNACTIVDGKISPNGWCIAWAK
jgi:hypothetical protein